MIYSRSNILVKRPVKQVYDFVVVDFARNYPRWSPELQRLDMLTAGPLRLGSRARQVRVDQGRRSESVFSVTGIEPPKRVQFAESGDRFRVEYEISPSRDKTRLSFAFELRRIELYMRPFEKLIRIAMDEGAERVVRNIKGLLEREPMQPTRDET